jgi:CHAT domain-containing protein
MFLAGAQITLNNNRKKTEEIKGLNEDGILTAYEVMNLNLDSTELVILSACETGLGDIVNGEGVYGLQRAFKVAGAKYIMMSLWNINVEPTRIFLKIFYEKWREIKDIRKAFKATQIEILTNNEYNEYRSPRDWGGFVLIGN